MKIALIAREYHKKGGVSKCVVELAEHLRLGHEIHIITRLWDKELERPGIHFHKVTSFAAPLFLSVLSFAFASYRETLRHRFDIVVSPLGDCLKADVFTAHSCHKAWIVYKKKSLGQYLRSLLNPLHWVALYIENKNVTRGNCKRIISVSNAVKRDIMRLYGIADNDITVVYNGINTQEFTSADRATLRGSIREQLQVAPHEALLIFVAHEFYRKGLREVIEAAAELLKQGKAKLLVVGKDSINYYVALAEKLLIRDKIIFLGPRGDVHHYFAASDIFVFPTKLEPFGLVITEAMASGLAVITSKIAGAAELIEQGKNGLLLEDPNDINELKKSIQQLIEDKTLREALGACAAGSLKELSWAAIAIQHLQVYEQVTRDIRS